MLFSLLILKENFHRAFTNLHKTCAKASKKCEGIQNPTLQRPHLEKNIYHLYSHEYQTQISQSENKHGLHLIAYLLPKFSGQAHKNNLSREVVQGPLLAKTILEWVQFRAIFHC